MTTSSPQDLRYDDRITIRAGAAYSTHTRKPLARPIHLEVLQAHPQNDGTIEVYGIELTARGAWRTNLPVRMVTLPAGSYSTPIRVGDTVHTGDPHRPGMVTALALVPENGTVTVDLLLPDGTTSTGHNLVTLTHLGHPTSTPAGDTETAGDPWPQQDSYRVVWHRAGHRNREIAVCTLLADRHTVDDIPGLVARRRGIRTSTVVLDSLTPIH